MTSPFPVKTHETMDLARALLEEDSSTCTELSRKNMKRDEGNDKLEGTVFRGLVVTKESSTEIIPTHHVDSSSATNGAKSSGIMRDLNAGKGMLDDDGKPAVGKVFSRVIQISSSDKPKQLKVRRGSTKKDEVKVCSEAGCSSSREKSNNKKDKDRPQSSVTQSVQQRTSGPATISDICPSCNRQFSDESMRHHMVFCTGSSKEIM